MLIDEERLRRGGGRGGGAVRVTFVNHIDAQYYTFKFYEFIQFLFILTNIKLLACYITYATVSCSCSKEVVLLKRKKNALKTFKVYFVSL